MTYLADEMSHWRRASDGAKSATYYTDQEIIRIEADDLQALKNAAREDPLKRARLCLHRAAGDPIQEMVIAFARGSYVPPHRHVGNSESFHLIEGELNVVFFNDDGDVIDQVEMGDDDHGRVLVYRLSADLWHSVVTLTDTSIIHETTGGPFERDRTELAPWGPKETDTHGIAAFLDRVSSSR